eukprot:6437191-Amphidinium_carterae.1
MEKPPRRGVEGVGYHLSPSAHEELLRFIFVPVVIIAEHSDEDVHQHHGDEGGDEKEPRMHHLVVIAWCRILGLPRALVVLLDEHGVQTLELKEIKVSQYCQFVDDEDRRVQC